MDQTYWGRPVPYFGDHEARRLIVGLAPAAHGANRTGRLFTGDRSGDWLFAALHRAGVANQPHSVNQDDGLQLTGALLAAACLCAPPDNKPLPVEIQNCGRYFQPLIAGREWLSVLCLGSVAWAAVHRTYGRPIAKFGHGTAHRLENGTLLVASYHPSQQNTFTGRLTEPMLDGAISTWMETG